MARYREAIDWIAWNDDTEWLHDEQGCFSVTLALVADVFGKTTEELRQTCVRLVHVAIRSPQTRRQGNSR